MLRQRCNDFNFVISSNLKEVILIIALSLLFSEHDSCFLNLICLKVVQVWCVFKQVGACLNFTATQTIFSFMLFEAELRYVLY